MEFGVEAYAIAKCARRNESAKHSLTPLTEAARRGFHV